MTKAEKPGAKTETINIRLTPDQKERLRERAHPEGIGPYLLRTGLGGRHKDDAVLSELSRQLGRVQAILRDAGVTDETKLEVDAAAFAVRKALGFRS